MWIGIGVSRSSILAREAKSSALGTTLAIPAMVACDWGEGAADASVMGEGIRDFSSSCSSIIDRFGLIFLIYVEVVLSKGEISSSNATESPRSNRDSKIVDSCLTAAPESI